MSIIEINKKNATTEEVRVYIEKKIEESFSKGEKEIIIRAGDIHEELNMEKAWTVVCNAMRKLELFYEFQILFTPKQKNGANLEYLYSRKFSC